MGRVATMEEAMEIRAVARREGRNVVFTNGCFDVLHRGHVDLLAACRRLGEVVIVAINSDASVRRLKGPSRPVVPERQRAEVVGALECVDWVVLFGQSTPLSLIRVVRPDVLAKGGDWRIDEIVGREDVESWGGRVERLRVVPGARTTLLIERASGG